MSKSFWNGRSLSELQEALELGADEAVDSLIAKNGSFGGDDNLESILSAVIKGGSVAAFTALIRNGMSVPRIQQEKTESSWGVSDGLTSSLAEALENHEPEYLRDVVLRLISSGYEYVGDSDGEYGLEEVLKAFSSDTELLEKLDACDFPIMIKDYDRGTYGHARYVEFWSQLFDGDKRDTLLLLARRGYKVPVELEQRGAEFGLNDVVVDDDRADDRIERALAHAKPLLDVDAAKAVGVVDSSGKLVNGNKLVDKAGIVIVPSGVTAVGSNAFRNNNKIVAILLPDAVKVIEKDAFFGLSSLKGIASYCGDDAGSGGFEEGKIILPYVTTVEGFPYELGKVELYEFGMHLESISLTDKISSWSNDLVKPAVEISADNMTYASVDGVIFSKDMTTAIYCPIENSLMERSWHRECSLPISVTRIEDGAFMQAQFKTVKLPANLKSIGARAFERSGIESIVIPASLETVDMYEKNRGSPTAPFHDSHVKTVAFEDGTTTIIAHLFEKAPFVSECIFPASIQEIQDSSFAGCQLLDAFIPDTVQVISPNAFGIKGEFGTNDCAGESPHSVCLPFAQLDTLASLMARNYEQLVLVRNESGGGYIAAAFMWGGAEQGIDDYVETKKLEAAIRSAWDKGIDAGFAALDSAFDNGEIKRVYNKARLAACRLAAPYKLSGEMREQYFAYLKKHKKKMEECVEDVQSVLYMNDGEGYVIKEDCYLRLMKVALGESDDEVIANPVRMAAHPGQEGSMTNEEEQAIDSFMAGLVALLS